MKVVLISGKAQSGKDTAAEIMRKEITLSGNKVLVTHYADLLKYICTNFFGWDGRKDEIGRTMLQHVGTDVIRKYNPDFWVDFLIAIMECFPQRWDYVIIPDCRYPNELNKIKERFDTTYLRIKNSKLVNELNEKQAAHSSEIALDIIRPDFYFNNDGTIKDFEIEIIKWTKENLLK